MAHAEHSVAGVIHVCRRKATALLELHYWRGSIPSSALLHPLYLISFTTGFTDPGTYAIFQTFASNQTGW
jgi:hypothetical protein